ncbi:CDP-diacylglycerol--serine O-phosphatidyltransferase [Deferribacterales bacterium RsTz2092]|nr:CDP-diacylglycerol--serine O-phosphatidyltransferase [Deferribacterales bacterium]
MRPNLVIPNMITMMSILASVYSMVLTLRGSYVLAAIAIIVAAIFDGMDGKVARLMNGASEFGIQMDSLADVISFGVAPAFLVYVWKINELGRLGTMVMFLYIACGALRLARFNVQTKVISNVFFVGLPIPAAATALVSSILFLKRTNMLERDILPPIYLAITLMLALLMVSIVPYYSFKRLGELKKHPFGMAVILAVLIFAVGLEPYITLFVLMSAYIVSGFIMLPFAKRITAKLESE